MNAETSSASLVRQLTLYGRPQMPQGYYRSKLFTASLSSNPLVAAAGPLLSLLERLCVSQTLPPIEQIRNNIEHELHAFFSRIQTKSNNEESNAMAYYLLCATTDELLGKNFLRVHKQAAKFKAFTPASHLDNDPQNCFFELIDFLKERPNQYLDLIELSYYCLIAGFEGKHHGQTNGRQILDDLLEALFQIIQKHRVDKPFQLFKESPSMKEPSPKHKQFALLALASISLLFTGYWMSSTLLDHKAKTLQYSHHFINNGSAHG